MLASYQTRGEGNKRWPGAPRTKEETPPRSPSTDIVPRLRFPGIFLSSRALPSHMHEEEEEETLATGKTGSGIVRIGFRVLVVRDAAGSSCDALTLTLSRVIRIVELDVLGS